MIFCKQKLSQRVCILFCTGVKGVVMDSDGKPVPNAVVEVSGRRNLCPFSSDHNGEYFRLLLPGNYTITVRYRPRVVNFKSHFSESFTDESQHNSIITKKDSIFRARVISNHILKRYLSCKSCFSGGYKTPSECGTLGFELARNLLSK